MSLNKVMLIGNVGKDPEVRYLEGNAQSPQGNAKVASFPLATTERYRDRNGEIRENTEWHNIVAWRGLADTCEKYVRRGSQLYIEGRIRTRSWNDQTGNKRYTTEIVADSIQLLGRRQDAQNDGQAPQQPSYQQPSYQQPAQPSFQQPSYQQPSYQQSAPQPMAAPMMGDGPADDLPF